MSEKHGSTPTVLISHRGADRLRAGHVWVYRSDVVEAEGVPAGTLVTVKEHSGRGPRSTSLRAGPANPGGSDQSVRATRPAGILGSALYSTASEIAIRMISTKRVENVEQLVRERVRAAVTYRERFVQNTNAYRVVFSEGDFLPGLIVDRYNDILSFQVLTQAMDTEEMRSAFLSELQAALN